MARSKFIMTIPGCSSSGCPHYVNNRNEKTYVKWAKGRTLYWGEEYCLHERQARQFHKSVGTLPSWCPRRKRYPTIRIYTGGEKTYFEEHCGIGLHRPDAKRYRLCRVTSTMTTPLQFSNKVRNRNTDHYDLLGWYPKPYDVIEIDVGLTQFYIWLGEDGWRQTGFEPEQADCGIVGDFQLLPHQDLEPCRYREDNSMFQDDCLGYLNGYFAGGVFRSQWTDNRAEGAQEGQREFESLLYALQTEGPLKSLDDLQSYCWSHWWANLNDGSNPEAGEQYGLYITRDKYTYYLRLAPTEYSSWNIRVFVYRGL